VAGALVAPTTFTRPRLVFAPLKAHYYEPVHQYDFNITDSPLERQNTIFWNFRPNLLPSPVNDISSITLCCRRLRL